MSFLRFLHAAVAGTDLSLSDAHAAMNLLVLISNCPQLNNPCNAYNPTPVRCLVWNAPS